MISTEERLKAFQEENNIYTKGPLSLVVQFTRLVQNKDFPLNPDDFQTSSKGQVAGLGGGNLKKILKEHGITQQLSAEGGRTSRGSMGLMIKYVDFLNAWNEEETVDFSIVEEFWAEQVREYFRNQPFVLTADTSKTIGANLDELFEQAKKRQKQNPGTQYLGTVLQQLWHTDWITRKSRRSWYTTLEAVPSMFPSSRSVTVLSKFFPQQETTVWAAMTSTRK